VAVRDRSFGPVYLAHVRLSTGSCPPHQVGVVESDPPWRAGKAILVPLYPRHGLVVGWWRRRRHKDVADEFSDELWVEPKAFHVSVEDIGGWERPGHVEEAP